MRDRIRCVLLAADDWTTAMIAKSQLIDETTVRRHIHDWLDDEKLKLENGQGGSTLCLLFNQRITEPDNCHPNLPF
ncbi:helix-turn-helix domain-containing protein [Serratia sp. DD3]|uniref:helix-turn-helix domain-containing protein n=1 Tax=Serratia sp. DD3 TaxID=1410619 RepID=UPI0003C519BA|nr:helix-turn-helix domain-containing protein [Serratia sp. DD3]KEY56647.1 hypothetical protein SRDD_44580 [Serratia sp. DD3]